MSYKAKSILQAVFASSGDTNDGVGADVAPPAYGRPRKAPVPPYLPPDSLVMDMGEAVSAVPVSDPRFTDCWVLDPVQTHPEAFESEQFKALDVDTLTTIESISGQYWKIGYSCQRPHA